jgi:DNA-binding MarR family transcriptional regulator
MLEIHRLPGHLIRRLHQISTAVFADRMAAEGYDLTPVQYAALAAIEAEPEIDQATLAGLIAYDRVTIGGVIDRLEQKGLVTRAVSQHDRRARVLRLSAAGAKTLKELRPIIRALQDDILIGLTAAEKETFLRLIAKATDAGNALSRAPLLARTTA